MIVYLTTFAIALMFSALYARSYKKNKKRAGFVFAMLAVFVPCIIAGLRAPGVGIDSGTYAYTELIVAQRESTFSSYLIHSSVREIIYNLLVYVSAKISDGYFVLYFISQILIIAPVYYALHVAKKSYWKLSVTLSYAAFLFIYYNLSLSVIRQSMATSFIFLGYVLYKREGKINKKTVALLILAGLTHSFSIVIGPSVIILDKIVSDRGTALWRKGIIIGAIVLVVYNINGIIKIAASFAPALMTKYVNTFNYIDRSGLSKGDTLMKIGLFLCGFYASMRDHHGKKIYLKNYVFINAIGIVFQFASIISEYLIRISYYYQFFMIVPVGVFYTAFAKKDRKILKVVTVVLLLAYWLIVYANWNWHGTMPFIFASNH